jgi:hypothetical protein
MKHIYSAKAVATALFFLASSTLISAQSPTTVAPSSNCQVLEDFNTTSGEFRSPSIFTESDYTQFNWDSTAGYWIETSGLSTRSGSMISPVYVNQQASGGIDVGFAYNVCAGAEYRIRIISVQCTCIGGYDIVATTANGPVWTAFPSDNGRLCIRLNDMDLYQGQHFRVEISVRNTSPCNWIIDDFSLGGDQGAIILPVTFMGITAKKENNSTRVLWDVADEVDVRGYDVEKSTNGVEFTRIGFVGANGKSAYSYNDNTESAGTVYYRVRNIDVDGKFKYSSTVKLTGKNASTVLRAFPIPARNQVTVQHDKMSNGRITLTTVDGRVVKQITPGATAIQTSIDLGSVAPGIYMVRVDDGNGNSESIKVIKQ